MSKNLPRLALFVMLLVGITGSLIPSGTSQAQSLQSEVFIGGGVNNLIVYPAGEQAAAEIARDTASEVLGKLAILFTDSYAPLEYESLVLLLDEPGPDNAAADAALFSADEATGFAGVMHTFSTPDVCVIRVFSATIAAPDILPFDMAHEAAHCMEEYYIAPTQGDYFALAGWWAEGVAQWAATLAYPDLAADALARGKSPDEARFLVQSNHALTDSANGGEEYEGYGSYFFWLYLTSLGDASTVIDILSRVPPDPFGEEDYQDYLADEFDSAGMMSHLGIMLAQDRVPYQVDRHQLFGEYQVVQMPQTVMYAPNDFTLDFNGFEVEGGEDVKAVEISTNGLSDPSNAILLAVDVGGVFTYLQDGAPAMICIPGESIFVQTVLSRGDGDSAVDFDITFTPITEEDSPCTEPVNPGSPRTLLAWRAVNQNDPTKPDGRVLFLDINDNVTIEVWHGPDIVYTRSGGVGPFTGTTLQPSGYDSFEAALDIIDDATRASTSVGTGGVMTYENSYQYLLTDEPYLLLTEINRRVLDYSMFSTCIGFEVTEPGRTWTTPDPLVPFRVDSENGTVYLGGNGYTGSGTYSETTLEPDSPMGSLETTFSITLTGDQVAYVRYESTLDGRADCRLVYDSMLVPYNGSLDALLALATESE